jgi:soluble lytic murein transglycosylase-like protein
MKTKVVREKSGIAKVCEKMIQVIFVVAMLFFATGTITNMEAGQDNEKLYIMERMSYWVNYWVNYYRLDKGMIDPTIKEKITKQMIEKYEYRLIKHESRFVARSRSWEKSLKCYSYGLTRITPMTAKDEGWNFKDEDELYNIDKNLKYGIKYFCKQISRYHGCVKRGIASYNAGGVYYAKGSEGQYYINQKYVNIVFYNSLKYADIKFRKTN